MSGSLAHNQSLLDLQSQSAFIPCKLLLRIWYYICVCKYVQHY